LRLHLLTTFACQPPLRCSSSQRGSRARLCTQDQEHPMNKTTTQATTPTQQGQLLRYAAVCALGPYLLAATALLLFDPGLGG
jgi:hypothetical protein